MLYKTILNKLCEETILTGSFNGIVSVEIDGGPFFEKMRNDLPAENPSANSLFFIGSITKQMLAAIILKYVEIGILDLYLPISHYLDIRGADKVTIEDLLTHTSGLVSSRGPREAKDYSFDLKKRGIFNYANQGYQLAAEILVKESGKTLEALYDELFLQCDMQDSFIINEDDFPIATIKEAHPRLMLGYMYVPLLHSWVMSTGILTDVWNIKSGYSPVKQPYKEGFQYIYPEAGNVVSTVRDLHKWNQSFGKLFKDKSTMQEYVKSRVFNVKFCGRLSDYCLGLSKSTQGALEYGQTGWLYGYQSTSLFFPEHKLSVVILENVSRMGGISMPPLDFSTHHKIVGHVRSYLHKSKA